ncbi:MAG: alpha-L-rhamnosidase [Bacteroidales bacterium]|nr:alpha-L-rhamnosidase [Bacteroidales bacterium]
MKKLSLLIVILTLLTGARKQTPEAPSGLMVEFIRETAGIRILDPSPEFSWIVPVSAVNQTAFQILVSSSIDLLKKDVGDKWDSGRTSGSQSTEVEMRGNPLSGETTYHWKVRFWDNRNRPSQYSKIQSFTTGRFNGYATTGNRFIQEMIKAEKVTMIGRNHYFADFGKDAFGTLVLSIDPVSVDTLVIHLGEKTDGPASIDRDPGGTIRYQKVRLPVTPGITTYTPDLPPDKRNTGPAAILLPDSIGVVIPFRYCEIENSTVEITRENIFQKALWHYFDEGLSSFVSSDTVLNQVWDICKYSMKATSFAGIYVDGDRERIPYEADAYINQLGHYYTDREYSLARRTNEYFIKNPTWPTEWILHTVLMFYYDLMHTGNIESVARYYEDLKHKTLLSLAREDGLISSKNVTDEIMTLLGFSNAKERIRDIVDWPPAQKDTGWKLATPEGERDGYDMVEINTMVNAFHYRNLMLMAELAGYLGKNIDELLYRSRAEKVRNSINEKLIDREKGIYIDGEFSDHSSLHANMTPLAFGLVPDEYIDSVISFIKSRGMACSVYGAQYLLEGLYLSGEAAYALDLMSATHDRSWWNMIKAGSTITMEAWDMKYKPNSDWNHAWGAAPANIIPGYMWGISPAAPGYSKAVVKPQLSTLSHSRIEVPTIRGTIKAEYQRTVSSHVYTVTIPGNMECDFVITGEHLPAVRLNNKKVTPAAETLRLLPGLNRIIITNPGF